MRPRICRMICSTSTLSDRTAKSLITGSGSLRMPAAGRKLRRFLHARREDAERLLERVEAGLLDLGSIRPDLRKPVGIAGQVLPVAEQPAPRAAEDVVHQPLGVHRIP